MNTICAITSLGGVISYFVNTFTLVGTFQAHNRMARYAKLLGAPLFLLLWATTNSLGMLWDRLFSKRGFTLDYFVLAEKP